MDQTISYYDDNAEDFCKNTVNVDMSYCWQRFLQYLKEGGHILDAGCGSGRDSRKFKELGYQVTAMDASQKICLEAEKVLGQQILCRTFAEIEEVEAYDGIWACASLLHVPKGEMITVLERIKDALREKGILYASFKLGAGEISRNGRFFNDSNKAELESLMDKVGLEVLEMFETSDAREDRGDEKWINVIARK
ncbi:methyltransferase domain-containing protein [Lachnospiraceae bacterium OttesenSCG-928-J05]|nr:methyltransferase domain-containing protein [Lachnospiraceae bacterium OttesenSCG-928-J05]